MTAAFTHDPVMRDEITDVFDKENRTRARDEVCHCVADQMGVEMTALSGVDLDGPGTGFAGAVGITRRLLVALGDRNRQVTDQRLDRPDEKRRLA